VHSATSPDSEMLPAEAIASLKKIGLGIAFTEHVDFAIPNKPDAPRGVGDFVCDFAKYPSEYEKFRSPSVALGLELGLTTAAMGKNKNLAANDYDFIIGSVHSMDGVELYHAITGKVKEEEFTQMLDTSPRSCIARYLTYAREMVESSDFFDAFGHIDYIARYHHGLRAEFSYENFPEEFDGLLKALAANEIALEINTYLFGGFAEKVMPWICRRFAQLGGRFCTIGSDAHDVSQLGRHFPSAYEMAETSGLTAVYYKERKPIRCG